AQCHRGASFGQPEIRAPRTWRSARSARARSPTKIADVVARPCGAQCSVASRRVATPLPPIRGRGDAAEASVSMSQWSPAAKLRDRRLLAWFELSTQDLDDG